LSTLVEPSANSATGVCSKMPPFSLDALVEILQSQLTPPSLEQLYYWLQNARIADDELRPYLGFKDRTYWRHLVCRNESVEMLVLCWKPGQRTVIHDHNGAHGAVLVQQGFVWESNFTFNETDGLRYQTGREYVAGQVTGSEVPDIHQLGNPDVSEQNLITIHIYAPPLGVLHTYKPGSAKIDLYTPDDSAT
jgi:cysteine dioxygenase